MPAFRGTNTDPPYPIRPCQRHACWQRAAKHFVFNRLRTRAATVLQESYRLHMRKKRCRRQRKAVLEAAGAIQQLVRAWVARRAVSRRREERRMDRAAATLQRAMWGHLHRRKEHRRRVAAALTLWKFMGGLSVKLSRMREKRRQSSAAEIIQSAFRMRRSRLRLRALRAKGREIVAASKIQAVTRGHRSRARAKTLRSKKREESAACTKIQAASRGHRSRVETGNLRAKQRAAAARIRRWLLRQRRKRTHDIWCERNRSALVVQRTWRKSRSSGNANAQRGPASTTVAPSKALPTLNRANLQLALDALANGVASCGGRSPSDARQLHEELALREGDPVFETLLCQRLSGLQTALTASCEFANKLTEDSTMQRRNGEEALLQSLRVLEAGLLRPSE